MARYNKSLSIPDGNPPGKPPGPVKRDGAPGNSFSDLFLPKDAALRRKVERQNMSVLPDRAYPLSDIVNGGYFGSNNVVISGGNSAVRFETERLLVERALLGFKVPTIIIHSGNPCFLQRYKTPVRLPGNVCGIYSPLASMSPDEAATTLTRVGSSTLGLPNIMGFWKLVTSLAEMIHGSVSLGNIRQFPLYDLQRFIMEKAPPERQMEFVNLYDRVADKIDDAQLLLSELSELPLDNPFNQRVFSLNDVVRGGGMVCIDIVSDSNTLYKELCFAEIDRMMRNGQRFVLVAENIQVLAKDGSYTDRVLVNNNEGISLVYGAEDVFTAAQSKPEFFQRITGGSSNTIVYRHNSSQSAKQWEEYFGQYYHVAADMSVTTSRDTFQFFNQTNTSGMSTKQELRSIIPERMILDQNEGCAVVKTAGGELWFSMV